MLHGAAAALLVAISGCGRMGSDASAKESAGPVAPVAAATVVRSWPHDPDAFTQGLVFHDSTLYESTGRFGASSLREVALETGEVVRRAAVPKQFFAEGIAAIGDRIFQLTWQNGVGFVYDRRTFEMETTFGYDGEGWGLTTDGTSLIMSDGTYRIRFLDPTTFQLVRDLEVRDGRSYVYDINELEWVRGEIWANVWHTERIARIDPATGRVVGWVDLAGILPAAERTDPEAVLNGVAYDSASDRIFVTGKLWPKLFQIRVAGVAGAGGGEPPGGR